MQIAELEQRTGISRHTLRYYEKEGLLLEVSRGINNYRDYSELAVQRIRMVRDLKALGFSLQEIREIVDAIRDNRIDCGHGAELMAEKRAVIQDKIRELQTMSRLLLREQKRLEASAAEQARKTTARSITARTPRPASSPRVSRT